MEALDQTASRLAARHGHALAIARGVPVCASCGATMFLVPADDEGYTRFCLDCVWPVDPDDLYVEVGGSG